MRRRLLAAAALVAAALLLPGSARAQWARDPDQPLNPTTMQACDAMADGWRALIASNRAQHQSCLSANERGKTCVASAAEGATCSCPACEALHVEMQSLPRRMSAAVNLCRTQVRAYEKQQREREEAERKRKEEAERKRKEEEERKAAEERARKRAEEDKAREDKAKADAQAAIDRDIQSEEDAAERREEYERERRRQEEENNRRPSADDIAAQRAAEAKAQADAEERERRRKEQMDRDTRALEGAAEMTQIQEELLAKRQAERQAYVDQLEQQQLRRAEEARARQGSTASALAEAFAGVKDALGASETPKAGDDLLGGFDIPSGDADTKQIHALIDEAKKEVPFAAIPFEFIRSSVDESFAGLDRTFAAIGDLENSDPRMLDDVVTGYPNRVLGPRNVTRILAEHWKGQVEAQASALIGTHVTDPMRQEVARRIGEAVRRRNPRALFDPRVTSRSTTSPSWTTVRGVQRLSPLRDSRNVPMLLSPANTFIRYDAARGRVSYTDDEVAGLIAEHAARYALGGTREFAPHELLFGPILEQNASLQAALTALQQDWAAGEVLGRALSKWKEDE